MARAMKKVEAIRQIVCLKQLMLRWKHMTLRHRFAGLSYSDSDGSESRASNSNTWRRRAPPGFLGVYVGVGTERKRFVIPARFLNLPVFVALLNKSEEEFGYQSNGGLVLPCDVAFFTEIVKRLEKDEHRYAKFSLEEFVKMFSEYSCKETAVAFTPLLRKARV